MLLQLYSDSYIIAWLAYLHLSLIIIPGLLAAVTFGYLDYVRPWQKSLRNRWIPLHVLTPGTKGKTAA